jgi:ADP-heptose:LPS heptosyltransferase
MMRVGEKGPIPGPVRFAIVPYTLGRGLDIGRGEYKAFAHFVGVREKSDVIPPPAEADFVVDSFDDVVGKIEGEMDFIFVHDIAYEQEFDPRQLAMKVLVEGGYLLRSVGEDLNIWRRRGAGLEVFIPPLRPERSALVIRYGAMGDMLQTGSVFPELKRLGYHITLNCHEDGEVIMRNDPHIDAFITQGKNQVPNHELVEYWKWLDTRFDRVINLCESVEGALLLHPGRSNHRWPHAMRKKYCNLNYLEFMAEIAELPFHPEHHFYPDDGEVARATKVVYDIEAAANRGTPPMGKSVTPYVVMWALAGSSVHKFYPHQDAIIARMLLDIPHCHILLVGDPAAKLLEQGWENEPRVHRYSGEMGIRDVLALAPMCQLVIGPETGVLNAVAFETCAKVVLLSHSTEENLTRDWTNTESVASHATPCYPCHRLHYTSEFCPQDKETGAAMCQLELSPAVVWEAVQRAYVGWGTVKNLTGV